METFPAAVAILAVNAIDSHARIGLAAAIAANAPAAIAAIYAVRTVETAGALHAAYTALASKAVTTLRAIEAIYAIAAIDQRRERCLGCLCAPPKLCVRPVAVAIGDEGQASREVAVVVADGEVGLAFRAVQPTPEIE
jgi:hypothetical protein